MKISNEMSLYLVFLHQEGHFSCKELKQHYPNYALCSIYQHMNKKITVEMPVDGRKLKRDRPKKVSPRQKDTATDSAMLAKCKGTIHFHLEWKLV